jgi:hypothetical protein
MANEQRLERFPTVAALNRVGHDVGETGGGWRRRAVALERRDERRGGCGW